MAEKVIITGGGEFDGAVLENAASEATLLRLVEALTKGGNTGGAGKLVQLSADAQKKNTSELNKSTESNKQASQSVKELGDSAQKASSKMGLFVSNAIARTMDALGGLAGELLTGGDKFSDFTKHLSSIPIVGSLFHGLVSFLDAQIDMYRNLSQVGATFGNDLFEMRRAAAAAGLPLNEFGRVIKENSNLMSLLGETTSDGSKRFGQLSKDLRNGAVGQGLMAMGFTVADVNDSLASYMNVLARTGRLQSTSTQNLVQEAGDYALEMDRLARITGIQRKELEKAVEANLTDAKMRSMRSRLEGDALKNFDANMALVDKQLPGLSVALKDLTDGVANNEEAQKLVGIGGQEFADVMQLAAKGAISPVEFQNRLAKLGPRLDQVAKSIGDAGLDQLKRTQPAMYAILSNAHELNKLAQKQTEAALKEQQRRENITGFLTNFQNAIARIRGVIEESLLKSEIFQRLKAMFGDFAEKGGGFMEKMAKEIPVYIDLFLAKIESFIKRIEEVGIEQAFKELFSSAMDSVGEVLSDVLSSAFTSLFTNPKVILALVAAIGVAGAMSGAKAAVAQRTATMLGGASGAGAGASAATGGLLKGMASGLTSFANPTILMGAGVLAGSIAIIGAGIAGATWLMGAALPKFAEGLKSFGDINGDNLVNVAKGTAALGAAMAFFGGGSALGAVGTGFASLTEGLLGMFGAKTPIEKLKEFAALGPEMSTAGKGFKDFGEGMAKISLNLFPDETLSRLEIGTVKLRALSTQVNDTAAAFKKIEPSTLDRISEKIADVTESLKGVGSDLRTSISTAFGPKKKSQEEILTDIGSKLDSLNINMSRLINIQNNVSYDTKKTAKYTKQATGNIL